MEMAAFLHAGYLFGSSLLAYGCQNKQVIAGDHE